MQCRRCDEEQYEDGPYCEQHLEEAIENAVERNVGMPGLREQQIRDWEQFKRPRREWENG